jgi:chromosomal replication initiator protein
VGGSRATLLSVPPRDEPPKTRNLACRDASVVRSLVDRAIAMTQPEPLRSDLPRHQAPVPPLAPQGKSTAREGAAGPIGGEAGISENAKGSARRVPPLEDAPAAQASPERMGSELEAEALEQPELPLESGADVPATDASDEPSSSVSPSPAVDMQPADMPGGDEREHLWIQIQAALQQHIQPEQFETWFRRAELRQFDGRKLTIAVQNGFTRYFITQFYTDVLERAVSSVVPGQVAVEFLVDSELVANRRGTPEVQTSASQAAPAGTESAGAAQAPPHESASRARQNPGAPPEKRLLRSSDVGLHQGYRFENFVVGPCNRFAHAAAVGVSESPGQTYNPFFLHGNVGLGKTHLMQSLCHSLLDREPSTRILYLSCETFVNHFISALENGDLQEFRHKYRNVDVLVVDDIHLLANKERTQEEFFHTFNTLYNAGKQIVLSSDSPPKDIPTLQGRLVSRFKWGLVTELEPPCYETRMAILKRKSRERGQEFPEDVARLLAEHIDTNIRELEGSVVKVIGYSGMVRQPVSPELVRECLPDLFERIIVQPTMEDVLLVVTEHFQIKRQELQSRRRTAAIAYARQVGMYLARRVTRLSLEEIGGFFGGRDHSTVLYAIQKIEKLIKSDATVLETVRQLEGRLGRPGQA